LAGAAPADRDVESLSIDNDSCGAIG
jgi:hypothetical protein